MGGNSSSARDSDEFVISVTFPRESNIGELQFNEDKTAIIYNPHYIDFFLTRTRIHTYTETLLFKMFSSK